MLLNINTAARNLGVPLCKALPALHALTGCDTVGAFAGRGKGRALNLVRNSEKYQVLLGVMGTEWDLSAETPSGLEEFTCELYGSHQTTVNVNKCR